MEAGNGLRIPVPFDFIPFALAFFPPARLIAANVVTASTFKELYKRKNEKKKKEKKEEKKRKKKRERKKLLIQVPE